MTADNDNRLEAYQRYMRSFIKVSALGPPLWVFIMMYTLALLGTITRGVPSSASDFWQSFVGVRSLVRTNLSIPEELDVIGLATGLVALAVAVFLPAALARVKPDDSETLRAGRLFLFQVSFVWSYATIIACWLLITIAVGRTPKEILSCLLIALFATGLTGLATATSTRSDAHTIKISRRQQTISKLRQQLGRISREDSPAVEKRGWWRTAASLLWFPWILGSFGVGLLLGLGGMTDFMLALWILIGWLVLASVIRLIGPFFGPLKLTAWPTKVIAWVGLVLALLTAIPYIITTFPTLEAKIVAFIIVGSLMFEFVVVALKSVDLGYRRQIIANEIFALEHLNEEASTQSNA